MAFLFMSGVWSILLIVIAIACVITTIIALVDILKSEFRGHDKIVWLLVILFLNFFEAILYFIMGRQQKVSNE